MYVFLFALIFSFIFNFILIIPFINLLYYFKFQRADQKTRDAFNKRTPIFDKFHKKKAGTPVGGGILIVFTTILLFVIFIGAFILLGREITSNYGSEVINEIKILLFTFVFFSFLGLYDDLNKIFSLSKKSFFGLSLKHKLAIEIFLSLLVSSWIYTQLKVDILNIPFFGVYKIGYLYVLFSTFVIVAFANAVNIADGLDGLASGILMIALSAFWVISGTLLDTPLSIFISVWLGGLIAFIYFNIYPARIFLGDAGALSFGATLAVIGLLLGKNFALPIIGGLFVIEIFTSLIQLLSKKLRKKKFFPAAPMHLWLQLKGWEEPKIVMRAWIISVMLAVFGLMVSFMK